VVHDQKYRIGKNASMCKPQAFSDTIIKIAKCRTTTDATASQVKLSVADRELLFSKPWPIEMTKRQLVDAKIA
jgi:hypothetical protein